MKKTRLTKRMLSLLLAVIITTASLAVGVSAAPKFTVSGNSIKNEYVDVFVDSNGKYSIGTVEGNPDNPNDNNAKLLYGWPNYSTSYTTIVIDGQINIYGDSGFIEAPKFNADIGSNVSVAKYGDIEVKQIISIVNNTSTGRNDVVEIKYEVKNNSSVPHNVGVRIMMDTMLGSNDSAPFSIPEVGNVSTQMEFIGSNIPNFWQAFNSLEYQKVISQGSFLRSADNKPDKVQFTNWGSVSRTPWNYSITTGSPNGDSAVTITWNEKSLAANATKSYATHYGLSELLTDSRPPLILSVYADTTVSVDDGRYVPETLSAMTYMYNKTDVDAHNAVLTVNTSENLYFEGNTHTVTRNLGTVNSDSRCDRSFDIKINPVDKESKEYIEFRLNADGCDEKILRKYVTLPPIDLKDNKDNFIGLKQDHFSFTNSTSAFFQKVGVKNYDLREEYRNLLYKGMDNVVKNRIEKEVYKSWAGSCYGMSVVTSLFEAEKLDFRDFAGAGNNPSCVYDLKAPKDNKDLKDLIMLYNLTQYLPDAYNEKLSNANYFSEGIYLDESKNLEKIIEDCKKTEHGGMPVLINFYGSYTKGGLFSKEKISGGHAMLGYNALRLDKPFVADGKNYMYKVKLIDPNFNEPKELYISNDKKSWYYEPWNGNGHKDVYMLMWYPTSEEHLLTLVDPINLKNNCDKHSYDRNFLELDELDLNIFDDQNEKVDLKYPIDTEASVSYVLPDSDCFTIKPVEVESKDIAKNKVNDNYLSSDLLDKLKPVKSVETSLVMKSCSVEIDSTRTDSISMDKNGIVKFNGLHSDCELALTLNETSIPWYTVKIAGENIKNYEIKPSNDGIIVSGNDLTSTRVVANNEDEKVAVKIDTNRKSVKLDDTADGKLGVYVDNDNNGSYETKIAESKPYDEKEAKFEDFLRAVLRIVKFILKAMIELLELVYNEISLIK